MKPSLKKQLKDQVNIVHQILKKKKLRGLKNIGNKNVANEDEILEIDENLMVEKNLKLPNKFSKNETTNEEEKRDLYFNIGTLYEV